MENLNIYERLKYDTVTQDELLEALAELIAWREMVRCGDGAKPGGI